MNVLRVWFESISSDDSSKEFGFVTDEGTFGWVDLESILLKGLEEFFKGEDELVEGLGEDQVVIDICNEVVLGLDIS